MTTVDIDFEWFRYSNGYDFDNHRCPTKLKPKAGKPEPYRPFEKYDGFAVLGAFTRVRDQDDLLKFYSAYGPLVGGSIAVPPPLKADSEEIKSGLTGDDYADAMLAARRFQNMLSAEDRRGNIRRRLSHRVSPLKIASVRLDADRDGNVRLFLKPQSLLHGLRLFAAFRLMGKTNLRACKKCGEIFAAGAGQKRDAKSVYCSAKCQKAYNNGLRKARGS